MGLVKKHGRSSMASGLFQSSSPSASSFASPLSCCSCFGHWKCSFSIWNYVEKLEKIKKKINSTNIGAVCLDIRLVVLAATMTNGCFFFNKNRLWSFQRQIRRSWVKIWGAVLFDDNDSVPMRSQLPNHQWISPVLENLKWSWKIKSKFLNHYIKISL